MSGNLMMETMSKKRLANMDVYDFLDLYYPEVKGEKQNAYRDNDYLENGMRIEDLARQKKQRKLYDCFTAERFNIFRMKIGKTTGERKIDQLVERISRELKMMVSDCNNREEFSRLFCPLVPMLLGAYARDVDFCVQEGSTWEPGYGICWKKGSYASAKMHVHYPMEAVLYGAIGGRGKVRKGFWHYKNKTEENAWLGSIYDALAALLVLDRLLQALWEQEVDGKAYRRVEALLEGLFRFDYKVGSCSDDFLEGLLLKKGYSLDFQTVTFQKEGNTACMDLDLLLGKEGRRIRMEYLLLKSLYTKERIPLDAVFTVYENPGKGSAGISFDYTWASGDLLEQVYSILQEEYEEFVDQQEYEKLLQKSVATAYMTKKNIPQVMVREMERSRFNRYFGYVEYDEEVDVEAVRLVTEEFVNLNETLFHGFECRECAIRIRKLGKHRALGLYFPQLNCMCIDLHSPESFIHEYYHLLDDQLGNLSEQYDFFGICQIYRGLLRKKLDDDKELGNQLLGNGKYNLKYYSRPTEVFARCGEMYLERHRKVKSSLLKQMKEEMFAYPDDEELNRMIVDYFDLLHERLAGLKKRRDK